VAKKFEWFGLAIIKRYLQRTDTIRDVHHRAEFFSKGIDIGQRNSSIWNVSYGNISISLKGTKELNDFNDWNRKVIDEFRANGGNVGGMFEVCFCYTLKGLRAGRNVSIR